MYPYETPAQRSAQQRSDTTTSMLEVCTVVPVRAPVDPPVFVTSRSCPLYSSLSCSSFKALANFGPSRRHSGSLQLYSNHGRLTEGTASQATPPGRCPPWKRREAGGRSQSVATIEPFATIEVVGSERCCAERCAGVSYGSIVGKLVFVTSLSRPGL